MASNDSQVPWTDDQWARVNNAIQEEAGRARVAATFLPMVGPLPPDTDFVRAQEISNQPPVRVLDRNTILLVTLQVKVLLRGAQMADPELTSALAAFRRAANVLARLEDAVVFNGLVANPAAPRVPPIEGISLVPPRGAPPPDAPGLQSFWEISGGQAGDGLWQAGLANPVTVDHLANRSDGERLVAGVSRAIGDLEGRGRFGPFALVLGQRYFLTAQTPDPGSLVLPQDRIIPFLGGGSFFRSSALGAVSGVVAALGGAPVELVVATDMTLQFLQVTLDPAFIFRVFEKIALRIKDPQAMTAIRPGPPV
jgi:uncharacterized linocin/CFP29 family protein